MPSGSGKSQAHITLTLLSFNLLTSLAQGLSEADLLLLRRPLHQLQRPYHRTLPHLQDPHLALRRQPGVLLSARVGSTTERHRPRRNHGWLQQWLEQRVHNGVWARSGPIWCSQAVQHRL